MAKATKKTRDHKQSTSANRLEAKRMFVNDLMTCEDIADKLGFAVVTVRGWKQKAKKGGEDWEELQKAAALSGDGYNAAILEVTHKFAEKLKVVAKKLDDEDLDAAAMANVIASTTDSMSKLSNAVKHLSPNISALTIVDQLLKMQLDFVKQEFPQHASVMAEILEPFGQHALRELKK